MLAPPPPTSGESLDKTAFEITGRERYLTSLERRLGKLEGRRGGRTELTSKDILQSLSEAKEDHIMVQRGTEVGQNGPSSWSSSGRESPFSIRNEFADVDLGGGGEGVEVVSGRRKERVGIEGGEERPVSGASIWTCCLRCQGGGGRRGYSRAARGTGEEQEVSRLVDCDELSLEWQSQDINDIT